MIDPAEIVYTTTYGLKLTPNMAEEIYGLPHERELVAYDPKTRSLVFMLPLIGRVNLAATIRAINARVNEVALFMVGAEVFKSHLPEANPPSMANAIATMEYDYQEWTELFSFQMGLIAGVYYPFRHHGTPQNQPMAVGLAYGQRLLAEYGAGYLVNTPPVATDD